MIEWGRSGSEEKVQTFRDVAELRAYTKETDKIFRNTFDQEGGNVVLRHLLRKNLLRELIKSSSRDAGDVESGFDDVGSGRSQCDK